MTSLHCWPLSCDQTGVIATGACHLISQGRSTNVANTSSWIWLVLKVSLRFLMISAYLGAVTVEANIDHDRKLIALLDTCKRRDHCLRLSAKKLQQFKINSVTSMEHKLTDKGVEPDPLKVEAINTTRQSSCSTFLRHLPVSRHFFSNLLEAVLPLGDLTKQYLKTVICVYWIRL